MTTVDKPRHILRFCKVDLLSYPQSHVIRMFQFNQSHCCSHLTSSFVCLIILLLIGLYSKWQHHNVLRYCNIHKKEFENRTLDSHLQRRDTHRCAQTAFVSVRYVHNKTQQVQTARIALNVFGIIETSLHCQILHFLFWGPCLVTKCRMSLRCATWKEMPLSAGQFGSLEVRCNVNTLTGTQTFVCRFCRMNTIKVVFWGGGGEPHLN
jgi:hypothetical protein